jgi:hypothetical protein
MLYLLDFPPYINEIHGLRNKMPSKISHPYIYIYIYRVSQNLCHRLFLGIPHPNLSKNIPINMGPKVNRFRDIDLRSCAGTRLSIT